MPKSNPLKPTELFMEQYNFIGENYFIHLYNKMPCKKSFNDCFIYQLESELEKEGYKLKLLWDWEYSHPKNASTMYFSFTTWEINCY